MVVKSESQLLTTLISRSEIRNLEQPDLSRDEFKKLLPEVEQFFKANLPKRFQLIEKLDDPELFFQALIDYSRDNLIKNPSQSTQQFNGLLIEASLWINQNVSPRAVLEFLALKVPF